MKRAAGGIGAALAAMLCGPFQAAEAQALPELVLNNHCDECHSMASVRIGPPFNAVALRYRGSGEAAVEALARKIILGGGGNWGVVPMVPNERVSLSDARAMARWIVDLEVK